VCVCVRCYAKPCFGYVASKGGGGPRLFLGASGIAPWALGERGVRARVRGFGVWFRSVWSRSGSEGGDGRWTGRGAEGLAGVAGGAR